MHGSPRNSHPLRRFIPRIDPILILMTLLGLLFAVLAIWLYFANRKR
jgi:LPS O-antigen subunit length determinant protein (WzzB/FepE family)